MVGHLVRVGRHLLIDPSADELSVLAGAQPRPRIRIWDRPGRESRLEPVHEDIKLLRRTIDIQDRIFSIRRKEQGESVLADFDMRVAMSV